MEDFFVIQLNADVIGDYPTLGEIRIPLIAFEKKRIDISGSKNLNLRIEGSGNFFTSSDYQTSAGQEKTQNVGSNAVYMTAVAGDVLVIEDKYSVLKISSQYATDTPVYKSLDDLNYMEGLTTLYFNNEDNPSLDLNKLTESSFALQSVRIAQNNQLAVGDIETIVENMLSGGKNSGTLEITAFGSSLKINGSNSWCTDYDTRGVPLIITFNSATSVACTFNGTTLATYNNGTWSY